MPRSLAEDARLLLVEPAGRTGQCRGVGIAIAVEILEHVPADALLFGPLPEVRPNSARCSGGRQALEGVPRRVLVDVRRNTPADLLVVAVGFIVADAVPRRALLVGPSCRRASAGKWDPPRPRFLGLGH